MNAQTLIIAIILLLTPPSIFAQEHLEPELGILTTRDSIYETKLREVFAEGYGNDVILTVLILESFGTESLVGMRKTSDGFEVFYLAAKTSIWDTELLRYYEAGNITQLDMKGNRIVKEESEVYQSLKQRTPADFRTIQIDRARRKLSNTVAEQIAEVWKSMLLETRYPKTGRFGKDGTTYHFSIRDSYRGTLAGKIWSPVDNSRTAYVVHLANSLRQYTKQSLTTAEIAAIVEETQSQLTTTDR